MIVNEKAQGNVRHVGDHDFEEQVLRSTRPVIVDFWGEWCPPCRALAPVFEKLSNEYHGKLDFVKLNADDNPIAPGRLNVMGLPTLIIFKDGQEVERIIGFAPGRLKPSIDHALAKCGIV